MEIRYAISVYHNQMKIQWTLDIFSFSKNPWRARSLVNWRFPRHLKLKIHLWKIMGIDPPWLSWLTQFYGFVCTFFMIEWWTPWWPSLKELVYLRNDRHKSGENCLQKEAGTFCLSAINSKLHQSYPHPPACSCCNSHFGEMWGIIWAQ